LQRDTKATKLATRFKGKHSPGLFLWGAGQFLVDRSEKGVWRNVLSPGTNALNPYGYEVMISDAVTIPVGYAGVVTSLSGDCAL